MVLNEKIKIFNLNAIHVTERTAQGSVLYRLHLTRYVNDPGVIQHSEICQFVHDTFLVSNGRNAEEALYWLQEDFDMLVKWLYYAGFVLNCNKIKLMFITTRQDTSEIIPCLTEHNFKYAYINS